MLEKPVFVQGLFSATGKGLDHPVRLAPVAAYTVPSDKRAQTIYFRAGNASPELIVLVLMRRDTVMRYFPVGAKGAMHVALAVQEDLSPDTGLEVLLSAPAGVTVSVVLDVGFVELAS